MKAPAGPGRKPGNAKAKAKAKAKGKGKAASRPRATKPRRSPAKAGATEVPASQLIDERIHELGGWRAEILTRMRALILGADREITEEWKWGTPVWSRQGIVCTGEAYKKAVKLTFARGAWIPDPSRLFNSSLEGNLRRAIDILEGEKVDAAAFKALVRAAVAQNAVAAAKKR